MMKLGRYKVTGVNIVWLLLAGATALIFVGGIIMEVII